MSLVKRLVSNVARLDRIWRLLDWLVLRPARFAEDERRRVLFARRQAAVVGRTFPDLTVRHGPFAGLRYPNAASVCSALLPKLLGSYERELHAAFDRLCQNDYPVVIDVGCAEGYYAVGLALRLASATVRAFDTDAEARRLCREMAERNGVLARVVIGDRCGPDDLTASVDGRRALVVCDCEGYELDLFVPAVISALAHADLVIETHDFSGTGAAADLADRFRATHGVEVVASADDTSKLREYLYAELDGYTPDDRIFILGERRPSVMEWLVLTAGRGAGVPGIGGGN